MSVRSTLSVREVQVPSAVVVATHVARLGLAHDCTTAHTDEGRQRRGCAKVREYLEKLIVSRQLPVRELFAGRLLTEIVADLAARGVVAPREVPQPRLAVQFVAPAATVAVR